MESVHPPLEADHGFFIKPTGGSVKALFRNLQRDWLRFARNSVRIVTNSRTNLGRESVRPSPLSVFLRSRIW